MEVFECIKSRRSIRSYLQTPLKQVDIDKLVESAIWAPSGKNGQPWKFKIITNKNIIEEISKYSVYKKWMATAPCFILLYLDKEKSYDYIKDVQSCGAAIQNIILCAHSMGIGGCWVGEILNNSKEINGILQIDNTKLELMGVVTLGHFSHAVSSMKRNDLESFLL